jgi:hypothetical protein
MKGQHNVIQQILKPGTALHQMSGALAVGYNAWAGFQNWLVAIFYSELTPEEKAEKRKHPPDAIGVIAHWAEAKDMEYRIDTMLPEQKSLELAMKVRSPKFGTKERIEKSFNDFVSDEIEAEAWIEVTDKDENYGPVFREVLNNQLQEALDEWQSLIEGGYNESYEIYSDAAEFCNRRDELEYAAMGIEILRVQGHFQDLPYYDEYVKRLKELDTPFRKLLNGETVPKPYADKTFWWRQPKK